MEIYDDTQAYIMEIIINNKPMKIIGQIENYKSEKNDNEIYRRAH